MKKSIGILFVTVIIIILTACSSQNYSYTNAETIKSTEKPTIKNEIEQTENNTISNKDKYIKISNTGDIVTFGKYEQDNKTNEKEALEWIVLEKDNNKALLLCKYCINSLPYNNSFTATSWEECTLREWLNSTFLTEAFTNDEQFIINTDNTTNDKVFLLSIEEANKYLKNTSDRKTTFTDYAISQREVNSSTRFEKGWTEGWWLRSMGEKFEDCAADVAQGGAIMSRVGTNVDMSQGVRPAIWVYIE